MPIKKPVLCCVEGGGVRQIENAAGVLLAMADKGIRPEYYMGSSAGAIISGLMASGMEPSTLVDLIKETPVSSLFKPRSLWHWIMSFLPGQCTSFFDPTGTYNLMKQYVNDRAKEYAKVAVTKMRSKTCACPVPQMCAATPATIMASMAIPCVFPPVLINGEKYEDGGVLNILPLPTWKDAGKYSHIYVILCNADESKTDDSVPGVLKSAIYALLDTMDRERVSFYESGWPEKKNVTVLKTSPYPSSLLDYSKDHGLITHAYEETLKQLDQA